MIFGYARVSKDDQNLNAQTDTLTAAGAARIFADKIGGGTRKRTALDKLFEQLREGDVVVVAKYDRLARSLRDLWISSKPSKRAALASAPSPRTSTPQRQPGA